MSESLITPQRRRALLLITLALAPMLLAQDLTPELAPLTAKFKTDVVSFEEQKRAEFSRLFDTYAAVLDGAKDKVVAAGNVKGGEAIIRERDAAKNHDLPDNPPADLPKSLHSARKNCLDGIVRAAKDCTTKQERVKSEYLRALAGLEGRARVNPTLSAQIAGEKEKVLRDITPVSPAGILTSHLWTLGIETWEFAPNGKLIQRKPSPPGWPGKSWKLSGNRKAVECVFDNGKSGTYPFINGRLFHWDKSLGEFTKEPLQD